MRKGKLNVLIIISATMLITALVLIIGFWAWLELYMVDHTVLPVSACYRVTVPGKPAISARLYSLGTPRTGSAKDLLVLTSKSSGRREYYWIDEGRRQIGLPACPTYIQLFTSAIVDKMTPQGFPLGGELKAEWTENETEVHIRIMGFSDAAINAEAVSDPNKVAGTRIPIGYQREIIFTLREKGG